MVSVVSVVLLLGSDVVDVLVNIEFVPSVEVVIEGGVGFTRV